MERVGAVFADDTTVPRDRSIPSRAHRRANRRGGYVVVEASIRPETDERADIAIRAAASGARPAKWKHVEGIVLTGPGVDAQAIRNRLACATIVITDPLEFYRDIDLTFMTAGSPGQSLALLASAGCEASAPVMELFDQLEYTNGLYLLSTSGVGRVEQILGMAGGAGAAETDGMSVKALLEELKRAPSKVHRLATKATTLVAYEHDDQEREERVRDIAERKQFFDPRTFYVWELEDLAGRRLVFDGGQNDITDRIEQLRAAAARYLAEVPSFGMLPVRTGYVVTVDDRDEYALQIADMAAGWAREIARTHGLLEVSRTFPLVLYNGQKLTAEAAANLDEKKLHHGRLISGFDLE